LPWREPDGVARGVEACRPTWTAGLLSLVPAGLLSLVAGLAPLVARPVAGVTAGHNPALAVAVLAEAGRLALTALTALTCEVLPRLPLAVLARLRRGSPAEPVGLVLWPAWAIFLSLVPAARRPLDRPPRVGGIVNHVAACPVG
jgi:hypothetical protein